MLYFQFLGRAGERDPHWTRREKRNKQGRAKPVVTTNLYTLHAEQQGAQHHAHKWNLASRVESSVDGAEMSHTAIVLVAQCRDHVAIHGPGSKGVGRSFYKDDTSMTHRGA